MCFHQPNTDAMMECCNACRHKLQPEAANDFTQKDTDTVPRAPQADVVAGLHGHHALDMPETSRPVEDSSAQVTHASITAAEGRAVADKGMSAAAEGRAMAGKGTWPAAEAKARKSVHDSSHMTTSDTSPAAMEFTVIADEGISAAAEGRAVAGRGISAAGKRAVDLQDPMPTLPLRCDTSPQGKGFSPCLATPSYNSPATPLQEPVPSPQSWQQLVVSAVDFAVVLKNKNIEIRNSPLKCVSWKASHVASLSQMMCR